MAPDDDIPEEVREYMLPGIIALIIIFLLGFIFGFNIGRWLG